VSVVPRQTVKPGALGSLQKFGTKLLPTKIESGLFQRLEVFDPKGSLDPGPSSGGEPGGVELGGSHTFARNYFLTGFTYGREIEDTWEYQIAPATWLTDRYFIRVNYHIGLGFGLRAPFAVDVTSRSTGADARTIELAVEPINVDTAGRPAYQAVGLPASKTFDGKEFVLEFTAGCSLYVSIPGPNIDKRCPSIDLDYSRDINPVLGSDRSTIGDWWLDGNLTGLAVNAGIASASLDVGIGAEVTNGRIGLRASGLNGASLSGVGNGTLSFTNRNPRTFTLTRPAGKANAGLRLDQPTYGFSIVVSPKLRAKVKLDVAILQKTWILGPWTLGFLSISQNFELGHHAGTVSKHDYEVFRAGTPVTQVNADATMNTASPAVQPMQQLPPKLQKFPKK
ncbi:MAG TPA: hypothetical protein VIK91_20175, partial [Nannocystis sp.]